MIDLKWKLLIMYVIKRIMTIKYKNRKKCALILRINNIKAYLQRKQIFTSTVFEMNICRRRSVWAHQRDELSFDSMSNNQNLEHHWRSDFGMNQDTFRDTARVVQPTL